MSANILTFADTITNKPKLSMEVQEDPTVGSLFTDMIAKKNKVSGDMEINFHFSRNLVQVEIDAVNNIINNFVEQDATDIEKAFVDSMASEGFDLYRRIVADIRVNGGLAGSVDNDQIPMYVDSMTKIRNCLKDGFYEYALRIWVTDVQALNPFGTTQEKLDLAQKYTDWLEARTRKNLADEGDPQAQIDAEISALLTAPKGAI